MCKVFASMKKAAAAVIAVVLALMVVACGSSGVEAEVRTTVDNTFAVFKNPTSENITSYIDDQTASSLTAYGVDVNQFLESVFKNLSYEIEDVKVDGDAATVKLSVSNVSLDDAMQLALGDFDTWTDTDEAAQTYTDGGESALYNKLFELLYTRIDGLAEQTVTTECELALARKEDGTWDVTTEGNEAFYAALYGGSALDMG